MDHDESPSYDLHFKQCDRPLQKGVPYIHAELWICGTYGNATARTIEAQPISQRGLRRCGSPRRAIQQAIKAAQDTIAVAANINVFSDIPTIQKRMRKRAKEAAENLKLLKKLLEHKGRVAYHEAFERWFINQDDDLEGDDERPYINEPQKVSKQ